MEKVKRKVGRPRKNDPKNKVVASRLNDEGIDRLRFVMERENLSESEAVRFLIDKYFDMYYYD